MRWRRPSKSSDNAFPLIYGGKILDGLNRYEACKCAKVEPRVVQFTKEHPKEYAASANLLRRHFVHR